MKTYAERSRAELLAERERVLAEYEALKRRGMNLNIARGKPGTEQLDLVRPMMDLLRSDSDYVSDGIDVRNYGTLEGVPACRRFFADLLGVKPENIFVGGNSSLQLMYDVIGKAYIYGRGPGKKPWMQEEKVRWLCPAPGYDRHFRISENFGMEMIPIPMKEDGPDMDLVEELVKDPTVKGMWCVAKYSNPDGIVYSEETVRRIASMETAAEDFQLMWDEAYCVHEFAVPFQPFPEILSLCASYGHPDRVYAFASTSKITFPGAGVSCFACSEANMAWMSKLLGVQIISFDKINQLRHALFLKDREHALALMAKHAEILRPKFACVLDALEKEIAPLGIARWAKPVGGYFVSVNCMPGTAMETWRLCKEAGLTLTKAGATWPYGMDPEDSNIRIAPTLPPVDQLESAMEIFCTSLKLAALTKLTEA